MLTRKNYLVWIGILMLSGMFLMGQQSWSPADPCVDLDEDGFFAGDPASQECSNPALLDCDDSDSSINPGATEICEDEKDNDCDGTTDEGAHCDEAKWDSGIWDTSTWN